MDLNYPTPSTMGACPSPTYFTHFIVSGQTYVCRVYPTGHTNTGYKLAIGVFNEAATVYSTYGTTAELAYGTTYRLVYSFDTVADKCSLWVNPTSETSTSILTAAAATTSHSISAVAFRQSTATPPWTLSIRNLYVARTFCEAALCGVARPPPPPRAPPSPPFAPPTLSTIYSIQYTASPNCDLPIQAQPLFGQIVMVEGYVTAVNRTNGGLFLQNSTCCSSCPCSPWSGIYVSYDSCLRTISSLWLPNAAVGDRLQISAPVGASGNLTQLAMSATSVVTVLSTNHTVQPIAVTTGAIGLGCGLSGESYEGMLVRFTNVQILSEPNSAGEILINDGSGPTQLEDTLLDTDGYLRNLTGGGPLTGRVLSSLTGVVYFSGTAGGSFEIFPRTADDVVLAPLPPPPPPRPPLSPDARYVAAITATFTVAGDVSSFNRNAFRDALATQLGVSPSVITLNVFSASVGVEATITYPSPAAASVAATTLAATPAATLSAALGVTVQAVANVAPTVITVVASPPPSPPPPSPPPSPPPPSPPPSPPPPSPPPSPPPPSSPPSPPASPPPAYLTGTGTRRPNGCFRPQPCMQTLTTPPPPTSPQVPPA
jgi:hypothetical protein